MNFTNSSFFLTHQKLTINKKQLYVSNAQVLITSMNMLGLLCRSSPPVLKFTCPASGVSVQQLHLLVRAVNLSVSVTEQEISLLLLIIITSFFFFVLISSRSLVKSSDP